MLSGLSLRLKDRNSLTLVKLAEVRLLGKYASTYCYNFPSHIYLELTARCNLRCGWCVQNYENFRNDYAQDMPFESFKEIIPKLKGATALYLNVNGEPLLYNKLFEAIALARKYVPSVRFVTNGVLLTEDACRELKKAGLSQLGVSIDSTDEEEMSKIRGVSLRKVTDNVRRFCEITNIPVEVRTGICTENVETLIKMPLFAKQFSTCHLLYFTLAEGMKEVEASPMTMLQNKERFDYLKKNVLRNCKSLGMRTNLEYMNFYEPGFFEFKRKGKCVALFGRQLAINSKGYIMPCCTYWGKHLESLVDLPFDRAWNGEKTRAWRKKMIERRYTKDCSNWCGYPEHSDVERI